MIWTEQTFNIKTMKQFSDKNLAGLLKEKNTATIRTYLEDLSEKEKGIAFEGFLAELYQGSGWLVELKGGRGDKGADILLYHPKTPSKASYIIQAKNHSKPLTFDQTKIELIKFEEQSAKKNESRQSGTDLPLTVISLLPILHSKFEN